MIETVILCIGSDMVSGDALGPTVGTLLIEKHNINCYVYGCIGKPVNAINIDNYIAFIEKKHEGATIIAIDACMGKEDKDIGQIKISYHGIIAGLAIDSKKERRIGDIGLVGIVAKASGDNVGELLSVPYKDIEIMAEKIADKVVSLSK